MPEHLQKKEKEKKSQGLNDGLEMGERMARGRTDSHSAMALKIKPVLTITTHIVSISVT